MTEGIQQLREQRSDLAREARNLLNQNTGDAWTEAVSASVDEIFAKIDRVDQQIGAHERAMAIEAAKAPTEAAADAPDTGRTAFHQFLAGGVNALTVEQRKILADQSKGVPTEGGFLVPIDFAGQLLEAMKAFGGMRDAARTLSTPSGRTIDWPTIDETAVEGEIVGENAAATTEDMTFGTTQIGAHKYSSKAVAVSIELLQDQAIGDLEGVVRAALARRIARITNRHFTTGTGTGQPRGVVTASTVGKAGATGQTTSVTYDDLVDLEHSIDPAYRVAPAVRFMFHDTTLAALKKLKDADGRPLWVPGVTTASPDTILGYPFTINQDMPQMAANARSILFGDFSQYLIRDVMEVTLFRFDDSAFITKGQIGFLAWSRHDGGLISAGAPIKHYANAAS